MRPERVRFPEQVPDVELLLNDLDGFPLDEHQNPVPPRAAPAQITNATQMPENCRACAIQLLPLRRQLNQLQRELEYYKMRCKSHAQRRVAEAIIADDNAQIAHIEAKIALLELPVESEWHTFEAERRGW